ncbi:MAG: hypothetical protein ACOC5K_05115 [Chloroflexota bacterium]
MTGLFVKRRIGLLRIGAVSAFAIACGSAATADDDDPALNPAHQEAPSTGTPTSDESDQARGGQGIAVREPHPDAPGGLLLPVGEGPVVIHEPPRTSPDSEGSGVATSTPLFVDGRTVEDPPLPVNGGRASQPHDPDAQGEGKPLGWCGTPPPDEPGTDPARGGVSRPMPVEPDGGIGDGATPPYEPVTRLPEPDPTAPMPVEPDGGIGDGATPPEPDVDEKDSHAGGPLPPAGVDSRVSAPATVEDAVIDVRESFPPQYHLRVTVGLPSGCVSPGGFEVVRDGNTVHVTVTNQRPADDDMMCTMIYGLHEWNIPLGSDFEPGEDYEVVINGEHTLALNAQ